MTSSSRDDPASGGARNRVTLAAHADDLEVEHTLTGRHHGSGRPASSWSILANGPPNAARRADDHAGADLARQRRVASMPGTVEQRARRRALDHHLAQPIAGISR